jgi:ABC-type transport system involved in Fe-S cluster assembly fused permease/ATPase subunit
MTSITDSDTDAPAPTVQAGWMVTLLCVAVTLQLIRVAMDLIQTASATALTQDQAEEALKASAASASDPQKKTNTQNAKPKPHNTPMFFEKKEAPKPKPPLYGSMSSNSGTNSGNNNNSGNGTSSTVSDSKEGQPLLQSNYDDEAGNHLNDDINSNRTAALTRSRRFFLATWTVLTLLFLLTAVSLHTNYVQSTVLPVAVVWTAALVTGVDIYLYLRDPLHAKYGSIQRCLHLTAALVLWIVAAVLSRQGGSSSSSMDTSLLAAITAVVLVAMLQAWFRPPTPRRRHGDDQHESTGLSRRAIFTLLKPYFWPDATSTTDSTAYMNRFRAIATWFCVISAKACNLTSPLLLGWASTALAHQDYVSTMKYAIGYSVISWTGSTLKEGQSLVYLKVAQAAFVQLSETAFGHLHNLSLDWHLKKKLGEVLRSMDRGIAACDTLMKYLFLWLIPAVVECLVVCVIFATYFQFLPLAISIFYFVFVYIVWTIVLTLWRKKFRKALVKSDNEWHDRFTDSLINFETVKFFTAEDYERERFAEAVGRFQTGSVNVQASLSFLNISQQVILQSCLATSLSLAAWGIRQRNNCCVETAGCESAISDCCLAVTHDMCPGMRVGDFVAVLTYTLNLFSPLNFLGSVYNAIVMAAIDLANLSELLAESPDVVDAPDAIEMPRTNAVDPDIAVEFDNVSFHYPTQNDTKGLEGLSFKMKRGTTTAIVGPTGAGKTTISRLLFRFYDVLGGAVKVNGLDVRTVTQKSLRGAIGVVPQTASMFNDTIRSNLLYGRRDATQEELEQAVKDAQLSDFIESLDDGWDSIVGDRGLKLSGGEKQRAAIARCLLKDPPFVLLDEATSALDSLTENSVQEALDRLGAERTVLVIAHRLGTIRNADNIIVLKEGRVAEEGTHDELLVKNGLYAEMWNMQLHSTSSSAGSSQVSLTGLVSALD